VNKPTIVKYVVHIRWSTKTCRFSYYIAPPKSQLIKMKIQMHSLIFLY